MGPETVWLGMGTCQHQIPVSVGIIANLTWVRVWWTVTGPTNIPRLLGVRATAGNRRRILLALRDLQTSQKKDCKSRSDEKVERHPQALSRGSLSGRRGRGLGRTLRQ